MWRHACVRGSPAVLWAAATLALITFWSAVADAAEDCLARPNPEGTQVGHWAYRLDHHRHRKCWYLARRDVARPPAEPADAPAVVRSPLELLLDALTKGAAADEVQDTNRDVPRSRTGATEPASGLTSAPTRPRHPSVRPAARGNDGSLAQAKRNDLYKEFLRWQDQAKREELFRQFLQWQIERRSPTSTTVASDNAKSR
jgi:hypothetical protein